jgi:hypothetical protein
MVNLPTFLTQLGGYEPISVPRVLTRSATGGSRYSSTPCVQIHEDKHVEIFQEQLALQKGLLDAKNSTSSLPVACEQFPTCQAALNFREAEIKDDIEKAYKDAWDAMLAMGEDEPIAAASSCFESVAQSICQHAKTEGWPYCEACGYLGIKW